MLRERRFITILLVIFVQMLGASMVLPILPLFAKREFEMTPQTITLLISSFFAAQFLAGPFIGRLSDIYGRVPVLIVSQIGTVISFLMVVFAQSPEMLLASRILDGITGGNIIVAQAYVTDIAPRENRTQALGYTFAVFGLGFVFGPSIGGLLSSLFGPRVPFLFAALVATITVLLTWIVLDESRSTEERLQSRAVKRGDGLTPRTVLANGPLMLVLLLAFGAQFGLGLLQSTFALYGEAVLFMDAASNVTDLGIGLLLGTVGIGQLFTQAFVLRPVLRLYGEGRLLILGTLLRSFAMLTFAIVVSPYPAVLGTVTFAAGSGLFIPAAQSLATQTVDEGYKGGVLGLFQSASSLSIIFATAIGGTLFDIGPRVPYQLGAVMFLIMVVPSYILYRWSVGQSEVSAVEMAVQAAGD